MEKRDFISFWEELHTVIDEAMEKRDRTVAIYLHPESGLSATITPWPDVEELYLIPKISSDEVEQAKREAIWNEKVIKPAMDALNKIQAKDVDEVQAPYKASELHKYKIDYGPGIAFLTTPFDPMDRFFELANTCFGIRKSITYCCILDTNPVEKDDYERLSFNGDEYIWRKDGARKMVAPEYEAEWDTSYCPKGE